MPRVTVGNDLGEGSHQAAGYDPAADRVVGRVSFPVRRAGFERFRLFLQRLAPERDDILVGLEAYSTAWHEPRANTPRIKRLSRS